MDSVDEILPETVDLLSLCGIVKPRVRGVTLADMERVRGGLTGRPRTGRRRPPPSPPARGRPASPGR